MTANDDIASLVCRAREGDGRAFALLVDRFQGAAIAIGYSWCGDRETAREIAQEGFLEAHRNLAQLRDPGAFPGWLRRIVIKHCDRVTRRTRPLTVGLPDESVDRTAVDPAALLESDEAAERLRLAVAALPATERIAIALTYFAGLSGTEAAHFLELPLSTLKQRLRRARRRLRDEEERLMATTLNGLLPGIAENLSRDVQFFIALRAGDERQVRSMIEETPALLEVTQSWDPELARRGVVPYANAATPLITAIELDHLSMLHVLLDAGADVHGRCDCPTGEAPIWAAALLGRLEHARALLRRGADPDSVSSVGNRALHVAAMRGQIEMVSLLLSYGADPTAPDAGARVGLPWTTDTATPTAGRTPGEWATLYGHTSVARLIEATPTAPNRQQSAVPRIEPDGERLHTGIKALDLFAPLSRGGLVRCPSIAGVGLVVLLGELSQRFTSLAGGRAIWTGFTQPPFDRSDFLADIAEFGLQNTVDHRLAPFSASAAERRAAFEAGLRLAETTRDEGSDVLAIVLDAPGFERDVETAFPRLARPSRDGAITTIVVTPFPERKSGWETLPPPFTGQIKLQRTRANAHLYPAIDPTLTFCRTEPDETARARAQAARYRLARYERSDADFSTLGDSGSTGEAAAAQALLRYLSQPFWLTAPFSGRPGEHVGRERLEAEIDRLLES
ncbi:MAG: sigma-70 family RNA polymerase sigma factor [Pseudomonadota bacterium]